MNVHEWMHAEVMGYNVFSRYKTPVFLFTSADKSCAVDDITNSLSLTDPTPYVSFSILLLTSDINIPCRKYGMSRCMDYAWKFMCDLCNPHINPVTVVNSKFLAPMLCLYFEGLQKLFQAKNSENQLTLNCSIVDNYA